MLGYMLILWTLFRQWLKRRTFNEFFDIPAIPLGLLRDRNYPFHRRALPQVLDQCENIITQCC